ncbi:DUF2783 domain-containing protein [Kordiimonas pumila]|uniref:DUF2783 domain-containing protein n=1 Tax=Kordiimonas pumila TaxID=2161677 RepID=A0ABV7D5W3_9PROT|nr:DUF2783 domain-containing protein [Kordiimonas pumila]
MSLLNTSANIAAADDFYGSLIRLHDGRKIEDSMRINARLILILANHVGDKDILEQALRLAAGNSLK